jgi:hypothetical protein
MSQLLTITFTFMEQNFNSHQYRVTMLGDFNVPHYGWINGARLPSSYY